MTTKLTRKQRAHFQAICQRLGWWPELKFPDIRHAFQNVEEGVHEAAHRVLMRKPLTALHDTAETDEMLYAHYQSDRSRDRQEIQTSAVTYLVVKDMFAAYPDVMCMAFRHIVANAGGNLKQLKLTPAQVEAAVTKSLESRVTQRTAKKILAIALGA